jgi:tetrahydrodipicolinate N-succinyltransferase
VMKPVDTVTNPVLSAPVKVNPGGKPVARSEPGGIPPPVTVNKNCANGVPTVPVMGGFRLKKNCVAPANACIDPSVAIVAIAERTMAPSRGAEIVSPAVATTRIIGVRCKNTTSIAPGKLSQRSRCTNKVERFTYKLMSRLQAHVRRGQ